MTDRTVAFIRAALAENRSLLMHPECYFGRRAAFQEILDFILGCDQCDAGPEDDCTDDCPSRGAAS